MLLTSSFPCERNKNEEVCIGYLFYIQYPLWVRKGDREGNPQQQTATISGKPNIAIRAGATAQILNSMIYYLL